MRTRFQSLELLHRRIGPSRTRIPTGSRRQREEPDELSADLYEPRSGGVGAPGARFQHHSGDHRRSGRPQRYRGSGPRPCWNGATLVNGTWSAMSVRYDVRGFPTGRSTISPHNFLHLPTASPPSLYLSYVHEQWGRIDRLTCAAVEPRGAESSATKEKGGGHEHEGQKGTGSLEHPWRAGTGPGRHLARVDGGAPPGRSGGGVRRDGEGLAPWRTGAAAAARRGDRGRDGGAARSASDQAESCDAGDRRARDDRKDDAARGRRRLPLLDVQRHGSGLVHPCS